MEYMRKVIYLKKRENNALMQGQGFARLEKRENNLLLYLSMHDITLPGENPVYIVCRQGEEDKAFPVGTTVQSDTWNFRSLLEVRYLAISSLMTGSIFSKAFWRICRSS